MNDGQIVFEVTADGKHAIADIKQITAAIQKETKQWDAAAKQSSDNISNGFSSMLKKLAAGFSAVKIVKGLLDVGKAAISAASDLEEVQNVVDVTFGENANKIEKWAKNAGAQFGLTETQAKRFASTMGAMLKSAGVAGDEIVDVSTDLAGLAADMASFYNLDFDTAFQKIRSGISGETEPLKQLGINMSVANLNAYALQQGLSKTFEQMSQGEQTMLRYQYMMSATADAQGDFARTSDGYANAMRKMETNIDNLKTALGKTLLPIVSDAVAGLNGFLESLYPDESKKSILERFAGIDLDTNTKIAEIQKTAEEANALIERLGLISDTGDTSGRTEQFLAMGNQSETALHGMVALGLTTDQIKDKQREWLKTCQDLVQTIPGLSEIINTETGEVKGGVDAVKKYVEEWKTAQEKFLYWKAYYAKEDALRETQQQIYGLEVTAGGARKAAEDAKKAYDEAWENVGGAQFYAEYGAKLENGSLTQEEIAAYEELGKLRKKANETEAAAVAAEQEHKKAVDDNSEAIEKLAYEEQYLTEKYGEQERAVEKVESATEKFWRESGDNAKTAVENYSKALQEMADYAQTVHDSVEKAVDSVVTGFEKIQRPTSTLEEQISELVEEQQKLDTTAKDYQTKWDAIQKKINDANKQIDAFKPKGMQDSLKSQLAFMSEYVSNLRKARDMGLSNELLASLSDGSVESAEYLANLVTDKKGAQAVDELFKQVQNKKKEFTDELSSQQLTVDETYQSLAEKAKEAVAELDQYQQAADGSGKTIQGIIDGINSHVDGVSTAVDAILAQLNRLSNWGVDITAPGFGSISLTTTSGERNGSRRMSGQTEGAFLGGLDFVPHDNFIARLHEGERVLTAQENQIWNALQNSGVAGFDLETLGGVMRDNIKPGGSVYLNGRVVGQVISDQQGKSYRQLQRSGWQG